MENSHKEKPPENISEKERKEKEATSRFCEYAGVIFVKAREGAKTEKFFTPFGRESSKRYHVSNSSDHMVAVSQREREEAEKLLESIREKDDYYEEKIASKLKVFLKKEEVFLRAFAEMETQFPEMAILLRTEKPYLRSKMDIMEKEWKDN